MKQLTILVSKNFKPEICNFNNMNTEYNLEILQLGNTVMVWIKPNLSDSSTWKCIEIKDFKET
jgi:hypothetical protein